MHWLSRKDSKTAPELSRVLQGATVVRTPADALRNTNVRITFDTKAQHESPTSPPLPPLPMPAEDEAEVLQDTPKRHRNRTGARGPSPASSLKSMSSTAVEVPPHVPAHIPLALPVPPFTPILVSAPAGPELAQSNLIVTIETSTTAYKSTLPTLCSRPSFLADYLSSLVSSHGSSPASSVYSSQGQDVEAYRDHLASQGLLQLPSSSTSLHIFLDRPSAPYAHILTFLRTPSISPEYPATLPRAVQLTSFTNSTSVSLFNAKLEALLELRDETAYLGLDSLHKLCTDEIRQRLTHATRLAHGSSHASVDNTVVAPGLIPSVGGGGSSIHSQQASVNSLHTLIENEADLTACGGKDALARVSRGSESLDEGNTSPLPPLGSPTSSLLAPNSSSTTPVLPHASSPPATRAPHSPRQFNSPSPATLTATRIPKTHKSSSISSSPSYTPPHSASSSPAPGYSRPPYIHKKAESTSVLPIRSSPPSSFKSPPDIPTLGTLRRPESKRGRPGHTPSPSLAGVGAPPGWL